MQCQASGELLPTAALCLSIPMPSHEQRCNAIPCPLLYWQPADNWGACSQSCVSTDNGTVSVSVSDPAVCMTTTSNGSAIATVDSACASAGLTRPSSTRPCNQVRCPSEVVTWQISAWSSCDTRLGSRSDSLCGVVSGNVTRRVECVSGAGDIVADSRCATLSVGTAALSLVDGVPTRTQVCTEVYDPCPCTSSSECTDAGYSTGGGMVCDVDSGECVCAAGWGGDDCNVATPVSVVECAGGVVDVRGVCCMWAIDAVTGVCCESADTTTDGSGRCCASGAGVDACGVCGGSGMAVDILGACCNSPLPPSGLCCEDFAIDSCGVCSGMNECEAAVTLTSGTCVSEPDVLQCVSDRTGLVPSEVRLSDAQLAALFGVRSVVRTPVCGNRVCEFGEPCSAALSMSGRCEPTSGSSVGGVCIKDCPVRMKRCPASCSGHGVCMSSSGVCACFSGYTGDNCSACGANRVRIGALCVFRPPLRATSTVGCQSSNSSSSGTVGGAFAGSLAGCSDTVGSSSSGGGLFSATGEMMIVGVALSIVATIVVVVAVVVLRRRHRDRKPRNLKVAMMLTARELPVRASAGTRSEACATRTPAIGSSAVPAPTRRGTDERFGRSGSLTGSPSRQRNSHSSVRSRVIPVVPAPSAREQTADDTAASDFLRSKSLKPVDRKGASGTNSGTATTNRSLPVALARPVRFDRILTAGQHTGSTGTGGRGVTAETLRSSCWSATGSETPSTF